MINQQMHQLGAVRSGIRDLFEYGLRQAALVGKENVFDYSLGNPSIPAPAAVNDAIRANRVEVLCTPRAIVTPAAWDRSAATGLTIRRV